MIQSIIWRTQTRTEARTLAKNWQNRNLGGHVPITFESQNLRIGKYLWKRAAIKWKNARSTSYKCWNWTVNVDWSENNAIWKSHNFAKNWPKMAEKWVKMIFPDHIVNRKVVDEVENYLNMKYQPKLMQCSRENGQKTYFLKNCL